MTGCIISAGDDRLQYLIKLDEPATLEINQRVNVTRTAKARTKPQRGFYWACLQWLTGKGGALRNAGHFSAKALHDDCKAWFESEKGELPAGSTEAMSVSQYSDYITIVFTELFGEFFGVDMTPFFQKWEEFCEWRTENGGGSWSEWRATNE